MVLSRILKALLAETHMYMYMLYTVAVLVVQWPGRA